MTIINNIKIMLYTVLYYYNLIIYNIFIRLFRRENRFALVLYQIANKHRIANMQTELSKLRKQFQHIEGQQHQEKELREAKKHGRRTARR